jgi:hypothetical protein
MAKTKKDTVETLKTVIKESAKNEAAARALAVAASKETVYEVKSLLNVTVSAEVADNLGTRSAVLWPERGSVRFLTASQILDIEDRSRLFSRGFLYQPSLIPETVNTILDPEAFVKSLDADNVAARIKAITSVDVLSNLYHHIESQRFQVVNGEFVAVDISAKHKLVLNEVIGCLGQEIGARISLQDAD